MDRIIDLDVNKLVSLMAKMAWIWMGVALSEHNTEVVHRTT